MADDAPIQILVTPDPALMRPAPLDPYLKTAMEAAVARVRAAGEANVSGGIVTPTGRPRKKNAPGYGPLAGSLATVVVASPGKGTVGYVRTETYYGRFLEFGTARHRIAVRRRARGPRALALGPPGGPRVFRHVVDHPGLRPRFWMRRAAVDSEPAILQRFEQETRRWAGAVFGGGTPA
jgi:hypothetical protein